MHKNIKLAKTPRRLLTATMGFVFMISLSACSDNSDAPKPSKVFEEIYASIGDINVTKGELWNELKWSADSKLEQYIKNVVLNKEIQKITSVLSNSEDELHKEYSNRIVDYVVQDIYNFTYGADSYWHDLEHLGDFDKMLLEEKYADELYSTYGISENHIKELISEEDYLTIAKELSDVYYPQYAKELFAYNKKVEEVNKADEEDDNDEDDQYGYYTSKNYVTEFENSFVNQHDLSLLMVKFASQKEYEDTLRAFGVKVYNKKFYFVKPVDENISYSEYCKIYDDSTVKKYDEDKVLIEVISNNNSILEIYAEMYNYLYAGYRTAISLGNTPSDDTLKGLRSLTHQIMEKHSDDEDTTTLDATLISKIEACGYTSYTREQLDEISSSLSNYVYNTLDSTLYSTSAQSYNDSYYLVYKLKDEPKDYTWYYEGESKLTEDEIAERFNKKSDLYSEELYNTVRENLISNDLTSSAIDTYLNDELKNATVKVYDEAVEISYGVNREGYSKTHGKPEHENVLATIEYEDKVWNFNIIADEKDENSVVIPGKDSKYGVYTDLEVQFGKTTAMDIISNECIKASDAYAETKENDREFYKDYIEALLYNFTNEAYSSSGFPASIGKYNFLMLYFHSADIDFIIDNFYCVQYASAKLLTDYSNDQSGVINFLKSYTDMAYDSYFSLTGKRFVVYFDQDDDKEADLIENIENKAAVEALMAELIEKVMKEVYASTGSHVSAFERVIKEINGSAKVAYDDNPVLVENQWAKYRKAGLNVKLEDFTVTNSTLDVHKEIKNRLAAYAGKYHGAKDYELIKNGTVPTEFIEKGAENNPVITDDSYNILLVTGATLAPSAKWEVEDTILKDFVVNYNDRDVTIGDITNSDDKLTKEQIKLYVLQYVTNGSSSLTPSSISSAISSFLTPVLSRYTADETQRIIIKYYVESVLGQKLTDNLFDDLLLKISQDQADNYSDLYQAKYETVSYEVDGVTYYYDQYANWWENLEAQVNNFLVNQE